MPRSSRHKSHKHQKRSSTQLANSSDSENDDTLKDKKSKEDSRIKPSRNSGSESKRKSPSRSHSHQGKDLDRPINGHSSGEHDSSKRPKERADERCHGSLNCEKEKVLNSKESVESKSGRSGSRRKDEVFEVEIEEAKKRKLSEKDLDRKEAYYQHKDGKEKDGRSERDKRDREVRSERSSRCSSEASRRHGAKLEEKPEKQQVKITEQRKKDEMCNPELEKEVEKLTRRREDSGDRNRHENVRDDDGRRLSSRDDHHNKGRYKDEKHKDGRYRETYQEDLDSDHRYHDKHRDGCPSKDRTSDKSECGHFIDEIKPSESHHKKTKLRDNGHDDSSLVDDRSVRNSDSKGKKRSSDDNEDHGHSKPRISKEQHADAERNALSSSKSNSLHNKGRSQSHCPHSVVADSTPVNTSLKNFPGSGAHTNKDQKCSRQAESSRRDSLSDSRQAETSCRDSSSDERLKPDTADVREVDITSEGSESIFEPHAIEKPKQKNDSRFDHVFVENVSVSLSGRSQKAFVHASPTCSTKRSPSTITDRQHSNKNGMEQNNVEEMGYRNCKSKDVTDHSITEDGSHVLPVEKMVSDDLSQVGALNVEQAFGSASPIRTGNFTSSSPMLPPPPNTVGTINPSFSGTSDDSRGQASDHKFNHRYKGSGGPNMDNRKGNCWKDAPTWPSPVVTNGFFPFQHGPPPSGFHAMLPQLPATPLLGVRSSLELSHTGVSRHMHDANIYSSHARSFGWCNPAENAWPSNLNGWGGFNGVFGDEAHRYHRPDWDQNRYLMSSQGWEMRTDTWKGPNGIANVEFPAPQKELGHSVQIPPDETCTGQSHQNSHNEWNRAECSPTKSIETNQSDANFFSAKPTEDPPKFVHAKMLDPTKLASDDGNPFCYLSKVDISIDLVLPELYKQCLGLLKTDEHVIDGSDSLIHTHPEQGPEIRAKSSNHNLRDSLFPAAAETTFQRAMTLYKQQHAESKVKNPLSLPKSRLEKESTASDEEKAEQVTDYSSAEHDLPDTAYPKLEEHGNGITNCYGHEESGDGTSNCKGFQYRDADTIKGDFILADGSLACETSIPELIECTVNQSRIHNSPESTH